LLVVFAGDACLLFEYLVRNYRKSVVVRSKHAWKSAGKETYNQTFIILSVYHIIKGLDQSPVEATQTIYIQAHTFYIYTPL
jgi:hypothetical protein